jgi:hypothetical protein
VLSENPHLYTNTSINENISFNELFELWWLQQEEEMDKKLYYTYRLSIYEDFKIIVNISI